MIQLNEGQQIAVEKALKWYYLYSYKKKYFILGGLAGTGKSTTIDSIVKAIGLPEYNRVVYSTFTAKASLVLRIKGLDSNTIHRTFYSVFKDKKGRVFFSKKRSIDENIKLIIVDEVSMASDRLIEDILSFNVPTILVGDPSQLPPVAAKNTFIFDYEKVDALLTQIMRQEEDSGILKLATMVRTGEKIKLGNYYESKVVRFKEIENKMHEYDVVLTWKNDTRRKVNTHIRKLLGLNTKYPVIGDKVLCLDNNYNYEITYKSIGLYMINGLVGICTKNAEVDRYNDKLCLTMDFVPDFLEQTSSNTFHIKSYKEIFDTYGFKWNSKFIEDIKTAEENEGMDMMTLIDFGYSLTVTKSQGSAFDNVLVLDECKGSLDFRKRWLYTAITRAKVSVTIAI